MHSKAAGRSAAAGGYRARGRRALGKYRWESRVLIVFAPAVDDPLYRWQHQMLRIAEPGRNERDVVVISVLEEAVVATGGPATRASARDLRAAYDLLPHQFCVVLVGKDGGVKFRQEEPVSGAELFALIDAMPMRRYEMRSRRQ